MIVTESQAMEMVCPLSTEMNCAASTCMCWRWLHEKITITNAAEVVDIKDAKKVLGERTNVSELKPTDNRLGYCGLAGRPRFK